MAKFQHVTSMFYSCFTSFSGIVLICNQYVLCLFYTIAWHDFRMYSVCFLDAVPEAKGGDREMGALWKNDALTKR